MKNVIKWNTIGVLIPRVAGRYGAKRMKYNSETGFLEFEESDCYLVDRTTFITLHAANLRLREEFEKWTVVYGNLGNQSMKESNWSACQNDADKILDTHQSRLMPPMPLRKETAEDLLREYIKAVDASERGERPEVSRSDLYARAKRVLEGK